MKKIDNKNITTKSPHRSDDDDDDNVKNMNLQLFYADVFGSNN